MTVTTTEPLTGTITISTAEALQVDHHIERLEEALYDAQRMLAQDDAGWSLLGSGLNGEAFARDHLQQVTKLARIMSVADPLIRRAVSLHLAFMWGGGVAISADQEDGAEQDVNAVIQAFLDDEKVQKVLSGPTAHETRERALKTDGEYFLALPTSPLTGRVQPRRVPADEVRDIITNPEDAVDVWFYERSYIQRSIVSAGGDTRVAEESVTVYYPDVSYRPSTRMRTLNGHAVRWDAPVVHLAVNATERGRGVPDLYAALPWAQGYKGFLQDWAGLVKALSRLAFKVSSKTPRGQSAARTAFAAAPVNGDGQVGQTIIAGEGQSIEAIGKSGATIDSNSGRPLAAMVASATDVPVTMLLADPGVTGARATAETLDRPFYETIKARQALHTSFLLTVLGYVVREAVRAPRGPLKGTVARAAMNGDEVVLLAGDQTIDLHVEFPKLDRADVGTLMEAISKADGMDKLPPELLARLAMLALGVDDIDAWLEKIVDANGEFIPPADAAAATAQQDAVAAGDVPPN